MEYFLAFHSISLLEAPSSPNQLICFLKKHTHSHTHIHRHTEITVDYRSARHQIHTVHGVLGLRRCTYTTSSGRTSATATRIHLTPGRFRLGAAFHFRAAVNVGRARRRKTDARGKPCATTGSGSPISRARLAIDAICKYPGCRSPRGRDSAPPLHVMVPPREFDGLPSAGAAPAL